MVLPTLTPYVISNSVEQERFTYSQRKKDINPYNTRPMESTPLLQPKSGI